MKIFLFFWGLLGEGTWGVMFLCFLFVFLLNYNNNITVQCQCYMRIFVKLGHHFLKLCLRCVVSGVSTFNFQCDSRKMLVSAPPPPNHLHCVGSFCRRGQGGTTGEENLGWGKRESLGLPFRHPNKSGLFCSLCLSELSLHEEKQSSGDRNTAIGVLSCRDAHAAASGVELEWINLSWFLGSSRWWPWTSLTGRGATGEKVGGGGLWPVQPRR